MPGICASMPKIALPVHDVVEVDDRHVFADVAELVGRLEADGVLLAARWLRRRAATSSP